MWASELLQHSRVGIEAASAVLPLPLMCPPFPSPPYSSVPLIFPSSILSIAPVGALTVHIIICASLRGSHADRHP